MSTTERNADTWQLEALRDAYLEALDATEPSSYHAMICDRAIASLRDEQPQEREQCGICDNCLRMEGPCLTPRPGDPTFDDREQAEAQPAPRENFVIGGPLGREDHVTGKSTQPARCEGFWCSVELVLPDGKSSWRHPKCAFCEKCNHRCADCGRAYAACMASREQQQGSSTEPPRMTGLETDTGASGLHERTCSPAPQPQPAAVPKMPRKCHHDLPGSPYHSIAVEGLHSEALALHAKLVEALGEVERTALREADATRLWREQRARADALEERCNERDADVVRRLRAAAHQAEAHDVSLFADQAASEIARTLLDAMPWMPTALHALTHAAADRLKALEAERDKLRAEVAAVKECDKAITELTRAMDAAPAAAKEPDAKKAPAILSNHGRSA